jgi:hypothetical protein
MHKRKKVMIQIALWAIWLFIICSWAIIKWQHQPALPLAYNLLSIIAVFYACRWMAGKYWSGIAKETNMTVTDKGLEVKYPGVAYYVLRWPFFAMIGIVFLFIIAAWYSEAYFINHGFLMGPQGDFYFFTYSSFLSMSLYVCGGNIMAAIEYHLKKEALARKQLQEDNDEKREIIQKYDDELMERLERFVDKGKRRNSAEDETESE